MRLKFLYLLVVSVFLVVSAAAQNPAIDTRQSKNYVLGPGDEITAKVLGEKDYDFTAFVNEDGMVEIPFHKQPIDAKCKTEGQLREAITVLLKHDLVDPKLSLRTVSYSRPPTFVYGEVRAPQRLILMRKATLIEVLAETGGVQTEAGGLVQVFRTQRPMCPGITAPADDWSAATTDGSGVPYKTYSLAEARMGLPNANPIIYPGDVVVVQRAQPIYIVGEVIAPQGIYLKEGGLTLTEAIAKVGGLRSEAKTKDIKIYRRKPDSKDRVMISANYDRIRKGLEKDVILEPEDQIEVGKAKESIAKAILGLALGAGKTVLTSGATNLGYNVLY